jgi:hypothetical protein
MAEGGSLHHLAPALGRLAAAAMSTLVALVLLHGPAQVMIAALTALAACAATIDVVRAYRAGPQRYD